MNKDKNWKKWLGNLTFCVLLIIIYKLFDNFADIFSWVGSFSKIVMPFILAIILAYVFYIPCRKIENVYGKSKIKFIAKRKRGFSTLTVYVLAIIFIVFVIRFVFPTLTKSLSELAVNLPNYYSRTMEYLENVPEDHLLRKLNIINALEKVKEINISEKLTEFINLNNISKYIKGVMDLSGIIFDLFVTFIVSIYLILERSDIKSFLKNLSKAVFNEEQNEKVANYYRKTNTIFFSFISSQVIDAFIVGTLISIVMSLMKVKYATLLGFLIGLFNIIPYFGAIVAVGISIIITLFTGGLAKTIWMGIAIIVLQQIDANIINPRILGNSLNLSPILVIFSVTIFGAYFGVLGMFLGVPIAAMIKVLVLDFIEERRRESK